MEKEKMTLNYTFTIYGCFEDDYQCGAISPNQSIGYGEIDYDYDIEYDIYDYVEYMVGTKKFDAMTIEEIDKLVEEYEDEYYNGDYDEDDFFYFLKEKYEEDAREQCEKDYGA